MLQQIICARYRFKMEVPMNGLFQVAWKRSWLNNPVIGYPSSPNVGPTWSIQKEPICKDVQVPIIHIIGENITPFSDFLFVYYPKIDMNRDEKSVFLSISSCLVNIQPIASVLSGPGHYFLCFCIFAMFNIVILK